MEGHQRWTLSTLHNHKGGGGKTTAFDPTQGDEDPTKHWRAEQLYARYLVCLGAAIAEDEQTTAYDNVNKPKKMT